MKFRHILSVASLLVIGASVQAQAPNPLITMDENGHGTLDFGAGPIAMPFSLQPDPGPGGLPSVLTYDLLGPPDLAAGDVFLTDAHFGNLIEDVIRFNPAGTGGNPNYPASVLFYSDPIDGYDSLADTPSPPGAFYPNTVTIAEDGPANFDEAFYTPTPGQPGYVDGFAVSYHFVSDSGTPEPGSLALFCGLMSLGAGITLRRRRR